MLPGPSLASYSESCMFGQGDSGTSPFEQPRLRFDFFKNKPSNAAVLLPLLLLSLLLVIVGYMLNMPKMIEACCSMDQELSSLHVARRARVSVCTYVCSVSVAYQLLPVAFHTDAIKVLMQKAQYGITLAWQLLSGSKSTLVVWE